MLTSVLSLDERHGPWDGTSSLSMCTGSASADQLSWVTPSDYSLVTIQIQFIGRDTRSQLITMSPVCPLNSVGYWSCLLHYHSRNPLISSPRCILKHTGSSWDKDHHSLIVVELLHVLFLANSDSCVRMDKVQGSANVGLQATDLLCHLEYSGTASGTQRSCPWYALRSVQSNSTFKCLHIPFGKTITGRVIGAAGRVQNSILPHLQM